MERLITSDERDRLRRIMRLPMLRRLMLLKNILGDHRVTPIMEAPLVAAVLYVLMPMNLIPRRLFLLRAFDDVIVAAVGLGIFVKLVPADVLEQHLEQVEHNLGEL